MNPTEKPFRKLNTGRLFIVLTVMLASIIEVLDMTIVNVALAPMMGTLDANSDQITWVLTSYIVSASIFMVLTGFLVQYIGRKKLLLINILGFTISSMLCGLSHSLMQIITARVLQGIFGASLVPLSQIILRSTYPVEEHGKAMAIWGIGIMVAPVMGPTLGGYITDYLNWRWIFFVNLPVGILSFILAYRYITESPTTKTSIDWMGLILMGTSVGALQIFLDRGNSNDWFNSHSIVLTLMLCLFSLGIFVEYSLKQPNPIINLKLFCNRNFALSCFLVMLFSMGTLALISLLPMLFEHLMNYSTRLAGLTMAPIGIASACSMVIAGKFLNRVDARWFMTAGLLLVALAYFFMSHYSALTDMKHWLRINALLGSGMGLFFVPISTLALRNLSVEEIPMASGLFSFSRNLGSSIGISILSTIIAREKQINWNHLSSIVQEGNPNLLLWLQQHGWQAHDPLALSIISKTLQQQSEMIAFLDIFHLASFWFLCLLPCLLLFKRDPSFK